MLGVHARMMPGVTDIVLPLQLLLLLQPVCWMPYEREREREFKSYSWLADQLR